MQPSKELIEKNIQPIVDVKGVRGVYIVRRDGLFMGGIGELEVDIWHMSALSAAIVGSAEKSTGELDCGSFEANITEASNGKLICLGLNDKTIMVVIAERDINLGALLLDCESVRNNLKNEL